MKDLSVTPSQWKTLFNTPSMSDTIIHSFLSAPKSYPSGAGFLAGNTFYPMTDSEVAVSRYRDPPLTPSDSQTFLEDNPSSWKKSKYTQQRTVDKKLQVVSAAIHKIHWGLGDFLYYLFQNQEKNSTLTCVTHGISHGKMLQCSLNGKGDHTLALVVQACYQSSKCLDSTVIYTPPLIPGWTTWNSGGRPGIVGSPCGIHVVYVEFRVVHVDSR